ncbi:MAG: methyltransferase domain-containing protein, partial [Gemmatimonadota bacterium]
MTTTYTWNADEYARSSAIQQQWAEELLDKLRLSPREQVLDLGCGDGKVTAALAAQVPDGRVVGLDSSPEMVEYARRHFPSDRHPNLQFALGDARALAFGAEFDVVFSNAALHWVVDHGPVVEGIARALRPGGRLLLQMGGRGNAAGVVAVVEQLLAEPPWSTHFAGFAFPYGFHGPREYAAWLASAGLEARRLELIPKDMVHAGRPQLAGWIRTTWLPYLDRVPDVRRGDFAEALLERYAAA